MNSTNKALLTIGIVGLFILIPFSSTSPDGFEKVMESLGVEKPAPIWSGLPSFFNFITGISFVNAIFNALLGFFTVLAMAWVIGWVSFRRKRV